MIAVVRIARAVVQLRHRVAVQLQRGLFVCPGAHGGPVLARLQGHEQIVHPGVPQVQFVGGAVCRGHPQAQGVGLAGPQLPRGVRAALEVVAARLHHQAARMQRQQAVQAQLDQAVAGVFARVASQAQVDHPRLGARLGQRSDERHRLEQVTAVAQRRSPLRAPVAEVHEDQIGLRSHPAGPARTAVARRDAQRVGAVRAQPRVGVGRVVAQGPVGIGGAQGGIKVVAREQPPISVRLRRTVGPGVTARPVLALVPHGQQPGAAIGGAQVRVGEVHAPVHEAHEHPAARRAGIRAPQVSREQAGPVSCCQGPGFQFRGVPQGSLHAAHPRIGADGRDVGAGHAGRADLTQPGHDPHAGRKLLRIVQAQQHRHGLGRRAGLKQMVQGWVHGWSS